ncbi:MAG: hypothetical protein IPM52_09830 [Bacteroidetes bacterium]|nr:hypothetical protein [Bacteroidota bacterium]
MNRKTTIALTLLLLGGIAAVLVYVFVYNKKHPDFEKLPPDYSMEAVTLFEAFRTDDAAASAQYNGKMVAVRGQLSSVDESGGLTVAVFVLGQGMFGDEGLRINMLPSHAEKLKAIPPGETVTVKGYVTGYNDTDVVLEHGSIVEP